MKKTETNQSFKIEAMQIYKIKSLSEGWNIPVSTLLKAVRAGQLLASRIGRGYRVLGRDALAFQRSRKACKS